MSQPPYPGPPYAEDPNEGQPYPGPPYPDTPPSYGRPPYAQPPSYQAQQTYGTEPSYEAQPTYGTEPSYWQQPSYGQEPAAYGEPPSYGDQHGYSQPGYGDQPGYADQPPYQPPPGFSVQPLPRRRSRALPIVLTSLSIVLVLCVGAGTAIFIAGRNNNTKDVAAEAPNSPQSAPATGGTPTTESTRDTTSTITLTEPKTLGGRPKLTDEQFSALADQLQSTLTDVPKATTTVGAIYGTPAKRDIVVIAGAAAPIADPQRELDSRLLGAGIGGLKLNGVTSVDTGSLGGVGKCGKADDKNLDMAMCGWADNGSIGWVMFFFASVKSAKAEFPKVRAQIEKKSG